MLHPSRCESPALQTPPGTSCSWKCSRHRLETRPPISVAPESWKRAQCLNCGQGQGRKVRRGFKCSWVFCDCCKARLFADFSGIVWCGFSRKQHRGAAASAKSPTSTHKPLNMPLPSFFLLSFYLGHKVTGKLFCLGRSTVSIEEVQLEHGNLVLK